MMRSYENSSLLCVVPAAGRGTRLGKLTEQQAKPAVAVGFDPASGEVQRMIDIPLAAIRQLGGTAVVTTHYAATTLSFVDTYPHVQTVIDGGYITPIDSIIRNRNLIEASKASTIGIVPADAYLTMDVLAGLCDHRVRRSVAAAILATSQLAGHNARPVNASNVIMPASGQVDRSLADLGIHVFDRQWLLNRIDQNSSDGSLDIWTDIYCISDPVTEVALYVPDVDTGWVDMGTPEHLQETIYALNTRQIDANSNVMFPGARLNPTSTRTVALPYSVGLLGFHDVIIPENVSAMTSNQILEIV